MLQRTCRPFLALIAAAALVAPAYLTAEASDPGDRRLAARWAEITRIDGGFLFVASSHDNRLVLSREGNRVRFHDRAMRQWRSLPRGCRTVEVARGIAATCRIPVATTPAAPLLLDIRPRLGNDRVNGSTLGAEFALQVRGADGNDVVRLGVGDDYFNGADGDDIAVGGRGEDRLVGVEGADHLSGNAGDDVLEGGNGDDTLLGGPGEDSLLCGPGTDTTDDDGDLDLPRHCEKHV